MVHGDRRPVGGLIPTDCARPAFSGSLFINREDNAYSFDYGGDCFPSVEVHALVGSQRHIVMQNRNSPASSVQQLPPFHRGCDMHGSVSV